MTTSVTVVVWLSVPLVPLMVSVEVPRGVLDLVWTVRVELEVAGLETDDWPLDWPAHRRNRTVEPNVGSLENRYPSLGGSRVQISPPPFSQAETC